MIGGSTLFQVIPGISACTRWFHLVYAAFSLFQAIPVCLTCFGGLFFSFEHIKCKTIFPLSTKINLNCFALCIELHTKSELFQIIRLLGQVYHFKLLVCCLCLFYFHL